MKIPRELEMAIANEHANIKSVNVTYDNGESVSGFVKSAKFSPLSVTLCKHQTIKGDNPLHELDFESATQIELLFHNGTTRSFTEY